VKRCETSARKSAGALDGEILDYLVKHPKAQDTVEGITQWWLLEQRIVRAVTEVKTALTGLVVKKLVITRQGTDGRIYYRLNKGRM